jgi:hypothetical protein
LNVLLGGWGQAVLLISEGRIFVFYVRLQNCTQQLLASSCPFVHMKQLGSHCMDIHKVDILSIFFKSVKKIIMSLKSENKIMCTLQEDQYIILITSPSILRMRNVSDKSCRRNQNTHFMFNNFFQKLCYL